MLGYTDTLLVLGVLLSIARYAGIYRHAAGSCVLLSITRYTGIYRHAAGPCDISGKLLGRSKC